VRVNGPPSPENHSSTKRKHYASTSDHHRTVLQKDHIDKMVSPKNGRVADHRVVGDNTPSKV
jgi:hypothetical protein